MQISLLLQVDFLILTISPASPPIFSIAKVYRD